MMKISKKLRYGLSAAVMAATVFYTPSATAQKASLDQRGDLLGWEAVGRLDMGDAFCSGVLIATDLILTAAHCVYDDEAHLRRPESMTFRAGLAHGKDIANRHVTRIKVAEGYTAEPGDKIAGKNIAHDLALLKLDRPIFSSEADPFRVFDGTLKNRGVGAEVMLVSFGRGRADALTREAGCEIRTAYRNGIYGFDCDATFGSSGAPVFIRQDGRIRIFSVISAGGTGPDGTHEALGMKLQAQVKELRRKMSQEGSRPLVSQGAKRITVGGGRSAGQARFVKSR